MTSLILQLLIDPNRFYPLPGELGDAVCVVAELRKDRYAVGADRPQCRTRVRGPTRPARDQ